MIRNEDVNKKDLTTADIRLNSLKELINEQLLTLKSNDLKRIMRKHYRRLHLMDRNGQWKDKLFENNQEYLLPAQITNESVNEFMDQIVTLALENNYLVKYIESCSPENYTYLKQKFNEEGAEVIPDVIAYSLALNKLTTLCLKDWHILEYLYKHLRKVRKDTGSFKKLPLFHKIKLISVELPIKTYLECHRTRKIEPTSGGIAVAINILEATVTDFLYGVNDNAETGWTLMKNRCGLKEKDPKTGAGPSKWSDDGKYIQRVYPYGKQWADLYQVWNLCFCTRFKDFVYVIPKLLIPAVADYREQPANYIYQRAIALYIYLNWSSFDYLEKQKKNQPCINWHDKSLSLEFAKSNRHMAMHYQRLLKK
ncbi:MAG: hypothetical protein Q4F05_15900 [bacterium]|nr:hypothetical protein [bacterium]